MRNENNIDSVSTEQNIARLRSINTVNKHIVQMYSVHTK